MKAWRVLAVTLLAVSAVGRVRAQPELEVRTAFRRLLEAGTYSWDDSRERHSEPSTSNRTNRASPTGTGETEIDGYTTAVIWRRHVVLKGTQAALKVSYGWRHANDLTDDEVAEFSQPFGASLAGVDRPPLPRERQAAEAERAHRYTHSVPHEVLGLLLQNVANFRTAGDAVAADLILTEEKLSRLEMYLSNGVLPPARLVRNDRPLASGKRATLSVKFNASGITEFSVVIVKPAGPGQIVQTYTTHLFKVGTTTVDVAPEVKALFLDVVSAR
jgi:hypothetical protein